MAKQKKLTMADCYAELERVCRIVCERKVDENELDFFRITLQAGLDKIAKIRKEKEEAAEARAEAKRKAEVDRLYGRNKK